MRADSSRFLSPLPLLKRKTVERGESSATATVGPVPLGDSPILPGQPLELRTWVCTERGPPSLARLLRFVSRDDQPLFRFQQAVVHETGRCHAVTDRVETYALEEGEYSYHFRWNLESGEPMERELAFRVAARATDHTAEVDVESPAAREAGLASAAADDRVMGPEQAHQLEQILKRLANVARLYRDNALRFTCDETIHFAGRGAPVLHKFRYLYRYSDEEQTLLDYRVPRYGDEKTLSADAERVRLEQTGLPTYLLRAYSWVFVFDRDNQQLYRYTLRGEDEALYRPAWRVDFEPVPPIRADFNDWFGSAWIDRATYQLLRVEAQRPEDRRQQRLLARMAQDARGSEGYRGSFAIRSYSTEFDVEKNGMRFPGRAVIDQVEHVVRGGRVVENPVFHISQTYKRYRFFGVRTAQEIRAIVESAD
jgi:hypothetical protein